MAAVDQDLIGWTEFLHGKVSIEIASIQQLHCRSSPSCRLTGTDWMKTFIAIYFRCLIPSGFSVTTLCTTSNGDICVCACAWTSSARYTSCWRPLPLTFHRKASACWNWTTPPCVQREIRGSGLLGLGTKGSSTRWSTGGCDMMESGKIPTQQTSRYLGSNLAMFSAS